MTIYHLYCISIILMQWLKTFSNRIDFEKLGSVNQM